MTHAWMTAVIVVTLSLSLAKDTLCCKLSKKNTPSRSIHLDPTLPHNNSILDFVTSIIASIVIFSILGELSLKLKLPIEEVVRGGQGLAFVAYPEAISLLPLPQLWAVLFFFMLYTLGLDSEFALLETVLTGFYDTFPREEIQ